MYADRNDHQFSDYSGRVRCGACPPGRHPPFLQGGLRRRSRRSAPDHHMQGMALCVLYIGVSGCLKGQNTLTAILSIALGAIIGELLDLDRRMRSLGDWVQTRTARLIHTEDGAPSISDGFVTASLLFCVGPWPS